MNRYMKGEIKLLMLVIGIFFALIVSFLLVWLPFKSDFKGIITNIQESSFTLEPIRMDPEAEDLAYEIFIDDKTYVSGIGDKLGDLKDGQEIKVWVQEVNERLLATKIRILEE